MDRRSDTEKPATAEEIRSRIRSEHARISALLGRVEALTEHVSEDDAKSVVALREELQSLGNVLLEHLHYEELFDRIIRDLDETEVGAKLVTGVRELARAIRDDMEHEEQELLSKP